MKVRKAWSDTKIIKTRAKRGKGTSAPYPEEIKVYENFFKIAIGNKKNTKTLVLGATPELRDLAIKHGSETIGVDSSPKLLSSFTKVMRYKNNKNNKPVLGDWLKMHKFLDPNSFDVVMGDISINNIPFKKWNNLFIIMNNLLKKDGYFITRQMIYDYPPKKIKSCEQLVKEHKKRKGTILGLLFELGYDTKYARSSYNQKTKEFDWSFFGECVEPVKKMLNKSEGINFVNFLEHAKYMISFIISEKDFKKIIEKYFSLKKIAVLKKIHHSHMAPIYFFKVKK